ncbi:hypothetical protein TL16_g00116 [Triparma laevis f. inornata]|uniref:Calmodulin n=1 Tax=Triparma laevis f. inornata TaxID=1714386 RepID=A0A9W6ZAP6_9STRA|nr:hypothetical protein TL16_g00116 [Triparma laevis f. inornata]
MLVSALLLAGSFAVFIGVVDWLFFFDIVRNFLTGYIDENGNQVMKLKKIAKVYSRTSGLFDKRVRSSFWLDIMSLVPSYIVQFLRSNGTITGKNEIIFMALALSPQIDRCLSLLSHFRMMELSVNSDVRRIALMKFLVTLFGAAHWVGCSWWILAEFYEFDESTWVYRYFERFLPEVPGTSASASLLVRYGFEGVIDQYELSLYWGFQALTNLGYSDILPDNSTEMVYAYILCMTQVAFYAYVLGNSTLFSLSKRDQTSDAFVKKLNLIEVYCQSRQLPVEVMKKMKGYYEFQSQKIDLEETKVMGKMPSSIFSKISLHKYGHHILNCPIFASPPPQFVTGIVASLRQKYLMPKEKLFRKGDMSREVCFVSSGSLEVYGDEEGKTFLNTVKNDGLSPTICGDLSFFLVIPQPHMVMASGESDVSLFIMSKINYTKCLEKYPESQHLIVTSLLAQMGLDTNGNELTDDVTEGGGKKKKKGAATAGGDDDDSFAALKSTVRDALKKRLAAALYGMMDAAREGDAERVKAMLMRGLDINATDYDHRTTLHLACAEGNLKVVELLIAEGANVHAIDRYGNNGLHYAVVNNHSLIADLLSRNGAELNYKREADVICGAAGVGNMDRIRVLVKYGIDVNSGDFDGRTALHLASSEGNLRVVELLLSMEADVNKKDRWGHTPLSDAVGKGHDLVAAALFARGGELNMKAATSDFMKASREGDLAKLKLFVENGINVDCVDYDISTALHVAAIADQPVAVDFLLSAKANVNAKSRWGTSPLDEAIASESVYCCKLIAACGGKAFVNAMAPFATEVAESEVCLETIRRDISNECVTQSKRSRAMHKLKQLHAKLMEDVSSSCETLARQCKSIETSTTKIGSSRLTGVGAKDQFKEADLEFDDGEDEEDRAQDSVLLNLLGGNTGGGGTGSGDDDEGFVGPPEDSNYMLNRFLHSPSSGWRRASEARNKGSYFNDPNSPGGDLQSLGRDVPQTVVAGAGEVKPGDRTFTTMNQVMLSFAKIEAGFSDLKGIFDTYAEGNYKNQVNVFELESILKSSGITNVSEPAKDIMAQCGGADLSETEDFSASERSSDKSQIKRAAGAEADQFISFKEIISSNTTFELFMYEENYVTKCVNKIGLTFQLARATFNLLDTGNEGCVNVRKLRQNESIMGELGYGEELFNCFGGLEVIYPVDMVVVLARWTSFVDDEGANNQGKEPVADANDNLSLEGGDSDDHSTHGSEDKDLDGFVKEKKEEDVVEKNGWKRIITKFRPGSRKKLEDELLKRLSFDYADNIEGIFSAYDVDNSGDIDKDEFTEMVHHLFGEKSFSKSDIERSFEYFDVDSTGELLKHIFQKKLLDFRDSAETASETTSNQLKEEETTKLHHSRGLVFDADTSYVVKTSNTFMTIAAFFYFLFVPYEICFIHNTTGSNSVEVRNIGWIFDCILYFDMFISFHTTYVNHRSVKVTNVVKIRKHYLAHGFAYDMIASLPFDFIAFFAFGASYSVLRWFRVPRLLRCVDIGNCFKRMRSNANKNKVKCREERSDGLIAVPRLAAINRLRK